MNHRTTRPGKVIIVIAVLLIGINSEQAAAQSGRENRSCAELTAEFYRSAACDTEIAAHPLPLLDQAVTYDPLRDLDAYPRGFLLPDEPMPYPVGWQRRTWYFADAPGVLPGDDDWTIERRVLGNEMYYVYQSVLVRGEVWHLIGLGKWMRDDFVSVLRLPERPEAISGRWAAVDLTQQTLIALNDDTPVFAALISSGLFLPTEPGLFQIYARAESMVMEGPPGADPPEYAVPTSWAMFFNGDTALHGASYHNGFGRPRSHGCVNMVPGEAEWLWNFFDANGYEWDPSGTETFLVDDVSAAPWVYLYYSGNISAGTAGDAPALP
ncbi:MAG: L,D-transpeptidase [Anaerolineae bacterium]|nr:L,D-transpeptidase [Anaerolineae bacterium]